VKNNDENSFFSVILAVLNAEESLQSTLDCLRKQTLQNFEVIFVDGGSTDSTLKIALANSDVITKTLLGPDKGIADAWNKGLKIAAGDWIIFLNAGDLLHPHHFERAALNAQELNGLHVLFCDVQKFDLEYRLATKLVGEKPTESSIKKASLGFAHPGSFTSRKVFGVIGDFQTTFKIAIDADFLLRCFIYGVEFTRFKSCAYMQTGGVSDTNFSAAMLEYYRSAFDLGVVSKYHSKMYVKILPIIRQSIHLSRKLLSHPARVAKHFMVSIFNTIPMILPFSSSRRVYYRWFGMKIGKGSGVGYRTRFYKTKNFTLGDNSVINRECLLDNRAYIQIGANVSVARGVSIYTAGHDVDSPLFELTSSPVTIGDHAVIFAEAKIMPGVTINDGAVILSGSVVTTDVPAMAVYGGVPARHIRQRLSKPIYKLNYQLPMAM
jgi:acetyltransferase-like isoleucine patch superfamily enzyme